MITTVDAAGRVNVAPCCFYNYVVTSPPMPAVSIAACAGDGAIKDTARNLRANGEQHQQESRWFNLAEAAPRGGRGRSGDLAPEACHACRLVDKR